MKKLKVLVIGCGNMGASHARAYNKLDEFELVGIVDRKREAVDAFNKSVNGNYAHFEDADAGNRRNKARCRGNLHIPQFPRSPRDKGD